MTFERDRVLMLRTSLAEERAHGDMLAKALEQISELDAEDYDHPIGFQSAIRVLAIGALKRHDNLRAG